MQVAEAEPLARVLAALADPTRLRIVAALTMECQSVTAIARCIALPQPLVSHHLRVLRERGLARVERRGASSFYCLTDPAVWTAIQTIARLAGHHIAAGTPETRPAEC